jgi:hypothetical protein
VRATGTKTESRTSVIEDRCNDFSHGELRRLLAELQTLLHGAFIILPMTIGIVDHDGNRENDGS